MPSGGYRPGGGRPRGSKDSKPRKPRKTARRRAKKAPKPTDEEREKIRKMMSFDLKAKAAMYQDFLVKISKGGKLTLAEKKVMVKIGAELAGEGSAEKPAGKPGEAERKDPLGYLLDIMNDSQADPELRFRAAATAAPFVHPKAGEAKGKKDLKEQAAKAAGGGRFAPNKPPILKVISK